MKKKIFTYPIFLALFLSFIATMGFGAIVKYHFEGGKKYQLLQKVVIFISSVPINFRKIISQKQDFRPLLVGDEIKDRWKNYNPGFNFKNKKEIDILFLLNYTNPYDNKHEINLIDLRNYNSIFKFKIDNNLFTNINSENNQKLKKYINKHNFALRSTFLTKDINLVALTTGKIIVKFSPINKEILWHNDEYEFHHTFYVNEEENYIWAIGCSKNSKLDKIYLSKDFCDDSIIKLDLKNGEVLDEISITQIMIDEKMHNHLFIGRKNITVPDPLHINDIEEINSNFSYFKDKNLFLSLGHANMILLIDPNLKKILWKLNDKLFHQHDVDIINFEEIAIFNNNRIITNKDQVYKNNEINIYNFKNNKLYSPYDKILNELDVRTVNQGLFEITEYGVFLEEQNAGRYIFFDNNGELIFEYINKSKKDVYQVHWSRLITDKKKINLIRSNFSD